MAAQTETKRMFSQSNKEGFRNPWVIGWIAFVVIVIGVNIGMVTTAFMTNPGLVEDGYYEKGQALEEAYLKRQAERAALDWHLGLDLPPKLVAGRPETVQLNIRDKHNLPVSGADVRLTAYRPSDATADFSIALKPAGAGVYEGYLQLPLKGFWDLKINITREQDQWSFTRRISALAG